MKTLPKMLPGQQDGKNVAVRFTIPFTLLIEGTTTADIKKI
jgi:hypothetical protein